LEEVKEVYKIVKRIDVLDILVGKLMLGVCEFILLASKYLSEGTKI
jgi:hypothetical protein